MCDVTGPSHEYIQLSKELTKAQKKIDAVRKLATYERGISPVTASGLRDAIKQALKEVE